MGTIFFEGDTTADPSANAAWIGGVRPGSGDTAKFDAAFMVGLPDSNSAAMTWGGLQFDIPATALNFALSGTRIAGNVSVVGDTDTDLIVSLKSVNGSISSDTTSESLFLLLNQQAADTAVIGNHVSFELAGAGAVTITSTIGSSFDIDLEFTGTLTNGRSNPTTNKIDLGGVELSPLIVLSPSAAAFTNYTGGPVTTTPIQNRLSLGVGLSL